MAEDPFRLTSQISGAPVGYMREEIQRALGSLGMEIGEKGIAFFEG